MKSNHRLLLVDDSPRNMIILEKILSDYQRATAVTGESAVEQVPTFEPDLVLLDIMLPGIDGYEVCRRIRAMQGIKQPKIIMVSAKALVSERLQGYHSGADDYISKPFNPDELLAKVQVYLRLKTVEELKQLKGNLITLLSHETRTPIASLAAAAELMQGDSSLNPTQRELATIISRSALRLNELVKRVMVMSTLHSGDKGIELVPTSLNDLVGTVLRRMMPAAVAREVTLTQCFTEAPVVPLDRRFGELVVEALLDNAIVHSAATSRVEVDVIENGPTVKIVVRDHGAGMPIDEVVRVMQPFEVADIGHHSRGHGLGLPIAKAMVEGHGGTLRVESEPGAGTIVTVEVPLEPIVDAPATASEKGAEHRPPHAG